MVSSKHRLSCITKTPRCCVFVMHNIFVNVLCSNYLTNQFNLQTQCCFIMSNNITRMTDHINTGDIIIEHLYYYRSRVCVCVCKIGPISARTLSFQHQTSRNFFSHNNFPIPYLWTAFCVPLSFIFLRKTII